MSADEMKLLTNEDLLDLIANGNQQAFDVFVSNNVKKCTTFCYNFLYHPTKETCEDLIQNVFLKIWVNAKKYNQKKAKASTWIYTILRNECINHNKRHKSFTAIDENITETKNNLDEKILKNQLKEQILKLPEKQKTAIILFYFQGYSQKEAADLMKLKEKAFESTLIRAKKKLRQLNNRQED